MTSITVNGNTYNDLPYDADTNPGGLANGGWRQNSNLINMLLDTLADASSGNIDTSLSSVAVGLGSKAFTLVSNRAYPEGAWVTIASTAAPATYMFGQITDHTGAVITVNVTSKSGTGTVASWTVSPAGVQGEPGEEEWNTPVDVASEASPSDPYPAVNKDLLFIDLSAGAVEVDLPAPAEGVRTRVRMIWAGGNAAVNNLRITPASGDKVFGQSANDTIVVNTAFKEITLYARALGTSPETYDWR